MNTPWHTYSVEKVFDALESSERGLSVEEGVARMERYGKNALPEEHPPSWISIFFNQFRSPLIYILLACAAVVSLMGELADGLIIFLVLIANAVIGALQEGRAQSTLRALRAFVTTNATVLRGDREIVIPDTEVVPGDILILQEGEKVPADARIIEVNSLRLDEASLTGESVPVSKTNEVIKKKQALTAEQKNMVFKGTHVASGSGRALVVATGQQTVIGNIATRIASIDTEIPLHGDIRRLSQIILGVVALVSVLVFFVGLGTGHGVREMFLTVISLAVSLIPEGLPITLTLVLATGVWRMSKRNALVKKLQAVEALGQARIIAVDKTGTITKNELRVERVWTGEDLFSVEGSGYEPVGTIVHNGVTVDAVNYPELIHLGRVAVRTASARLSYVEDEKRWRVAGDPTEAALLVLGTKLGLHREEVLREAPVYSEMPFNAAYRYHTVVTASGKGAELNITGAPESVIAACTHYIQGGTRRALTQKMRHTTEERVTQLSQEGLRVLALATKSRTSKDFSPEDVKGLTLCGLVGMKDTLRTEARDAIHTAREAGMRVVMITGDHKITARAIALEAGIYLEGDGVLTGAEIDTLSESQLSHELGKTSVFARVTPEHKMRLITAYKKRGEVIAMTGDGVNDAPSLVAADLGISMGHIGTEVAKEASDIILLDDNFGSIVAAVEEGRSIYRTIKKVVLYLFSTSAAEALVILGALILGYPLPLLASQIIWLNFVTDGFLVAALAMEPKERDLLKGTFQRPNRYFFDRLMLVRMLFMAGIMTIGTLVVFREYLIFDPEKALTMSLTVLAIFQWFNAWNCRSDRRSVFVESIFANKYLIAATGTVVVLQLLAVYHPFLQKILHTTPLSAFDWGIALCGAVTVILVEEVRKVFFRRRSVGV